MRDVRSDIVEDAGVRDSLTSAVAASHKGRAGPSTRRRSGAPSTDNLRDFKQPPHDTEIITGAPFTIRETAAENLLLVRLWSYQVDVLTNSGRPVKLALATTALGVCLGSLPNTLHAASLVWNNKPIGKADLISLVIWGACFAAALIIGFQSLESEVHVLAIKKEIKLIPSRSIDSDGKPFEGRGDFT